MKAIWINNILYKHQDKVMNHYNLESADEYVKKVFSRCGVHGKKIKRDVDMSR